MCLIGSSAYGFVPSSNLTFAIINRPDIWHADYTYDTVSRDDKFLNSFLKEQKRSTEGCSKFKSPETRQVQERLVSTLEHMQVPKWDRTRCPEE